MQQVQIAVVGLGRMGHRFLQIAQSIPLIEIVGVYDVDEATSAQTAVQFSASRYRSLNEVCTDSSTNAVIIATPEDMHTDAVLACLRAGKAVFVEKPLATKVADAEAMIAAAAENQTCLAVGHTLRLDPAYDEARRAVRSGKIGTLVYASAQRSSAISDMGRLRQRTSLVDYLIIHDLDAFLWITEETVAAVVAGGTSVPGWSGTPDAVQVRMQLASGGMASFESHWIRPGSAPNMWGAQMSLWGTDGAIRVEPYVTAVTIAGDAGVISQNQAYIREPNSAGTVTGVYRDEILNFAGACLGQGAPVCSGKDALKSVLVANSIKEALRTHQEIRIGVI